MDGWVTIGAVLDTKELEKGIKESKKELKQYEKEAEKLTKQKLKAETDLEPYKKETEELRKTHLEELKLAKSESERAEILKVNEEILSRINDKYKEQISNYNEVNQKIQENANNQQRLNDNITKMEEQLQQAKGFEAVKKQIKEASNSMVGLLKKVAKWTLAIIGVRSAYSMIRSSISTISQYNEQFATDLEYIRYALANALQPVIERIVKLAQTLLTYINYIWKVWFGKELFASAKSFENMKKSSSGVAKNVKEIKKQLAGFDEMNILNEDGSTSAGGVSGGITAPSIDLTDWNSIEIPKWIKWIANNKDVVLGFLKGVAIGLAAIKIAQFISSLSGIFGILKGITGLQLLVLISGIVTAITGVITLIQGIIAFIKDPSWDNFNKILEGLTLTLLGVGAAMVALNATNPIGWIVLAAGAITGLVTACSSLAKELFEDKAQILDTKTAQEQLTEAIENAKNATDEYVSAVDNAEEAQKRLEEAEKKNKLSGEELYKAVQNGTLDYKDMNEAQREVYKAYLNNQSAQERLQTATENLSEAKRKEKEASWENELAIAKESKSYDSFRDSVVKAFEDGELSAGEARDYIERAMATMSKSTADAFTKDIPNDIKNGLDPTKYQSTFTKFKNGFLNMLNGIKEGASSALSWLKSKLGFSSGGVAFSTGGVGFAKGGVTGFAKGGVNVVKMASGSIISQPGRGVPMTRAIGGEAGHEGIIPLTNAQMMSQLGAEIGRNVNITLTNVTKLDNRQIAREQKVINAQSDFAFNR